MVTHMNSDLFVGYQCLGVIICHAHVIFRDTIRNDVIRNERVVFNINLLHIFDINFVYQVHDIIDNTYYLGRMIHESH